MAPVCMFLSLCLAASPDPWQPVLDLVGVSRAEAGVDRDTMALFGGGAHRLPWFDHLLGDPWRVPEAARTQGAGWVAAAGVADALARAGTFASWGVRRGLTEPVPAALRRELAAENPLAAALAGLRGTLTLPAGEPATADLPLTLQTEVALLLTVLAQQPAWRERAFENAPAAGLGPHLQDLLRFATVDDEGAAGTESLAHERRLDRLVNSLDLPSLAAGAMDLALVLDEVRARLAGVDLGPVTTRRWSTPLGDVVVGGRGADTHGGPSPLLIVEVGGDDRYESGAAAADPQRPVSVILDLGGHDRYETTQPGSWGAAVGGVAMLVDVAGNDRYAGGDVTQGCGIGGVGLLWDGAGDDVYVGRVHAQGAAAFGLGVLADRGGRDTYDAVHRSQGYGYTLGCGALVDAAGDDTYTADDQNLLFKSAQTAEHNTSLCQGFGFGRRADYTTGHSLAGGFGWLVDGGGSDQYRCGVFGQGGGYWYGTGLLADLGGDDRYEGVWYVQGAAAHFAIGGLLDSAGNDQYLATMNMAQGAGHDFSLGVLVDEGGNDRYQAPNLALGAGNANGIGLFWELAGDDVYEAKEGVNLGMARTPGRAADLAHSPRRLARCLGLFLDSGGRDQYPRAGQGDGRSWHEAQPDTAARGAGVDR